MEEERLRIVEYMDRKKETEILVDTAEFWMKMDKIACLKAGMEKQENIKKDRLEKKREKKWFYENCRQPNLILTGWTDWWNMIEVESESFRRMDGLEIVRERQLFYSDRVQPNIILFDWLPWWNKNGAGSSGRKKDGQDKEKKQEKRPFPSPFTTKGKDGG